MNIKSIDLSTENRKTQALLNLNFDINTQDFLNAVNSKLAVNCISKFQVDSNLHSCEITFINEWYHTKIADNLQFRCQFVDLLANLDDIDTEIESENKLIRLLVNLSSNAAESEMELGQEIPTAQTKIDLMKKNCEKSAPSLSTVLDDLIDSVEYLENKTYT